jgi:hypothetical protein
MCVFVCDSKWENEARQTIMVLFMYINIYKIYSSILLLLVWVVSFLPRKKEEFYLFIFVFMKITK